MLCPDDSHAVQVKRNQCTSACKYDQGWFCLFSVSLECSHVQQLSDVTIYKVTSLVSFGIA